MSSRLVTVRLPEALATQLGAFCAMAGQTVSDVVRGALAYALARPGLYAELCAHPVPTIFEELRTPEQQAAYADYERAMEAFDMGTIVRESGLG
jgi:hypothetical protein